MSQRQEPKAPSGEPGSGQRAAADKRKPATTKKERLLRLQAALAAQAERTVLAWQERLFDGAVEPPVLLEAARYFQPLHLQEVVIERNASNVCGYPLCDRRCQEIKGKYRISLRENRIYDASEERSFCGQGCMVAVRYLSSQLSKEAVYARNVKAAPVLELLPPRLTLEEIKARLRGQGRHSSSQDSQRQSYVSSLSTRMAKLDLEKDPSPLSLHVVERFNAV